MAIPGSVPAHGSDPFQMDGARADDGDYYVDETIGEEAHAPCQRAR